MPVRDVKLFDTEVQQGHGQDQGSLTCQSEMSNCLTQRSSKGMDRTKGPSHVSQRCDTDLTSSQESPHRLIRDVADSHSMNINCLLLDYQ